MSPQVRLGQLPLSPVMRTAPRCYWQLLVVRDACSLLDTSLRPPVDLRQPSRVRIDQVNSRTDRAGDWLESIFRAFGWIVRDKCLDVVPGHRTSVDKGGHDEAAIFNRAFWQSTTDVYVVGGNRSGSRLRSRSCLSYLRIAQRGLVLMSAFGGKADIV